MEYATEKGFSTSVHQWKPCTTEAFSRLLYEYAVENSGVTGGEGVIPTAVRLDAASTAVIWFARLRPTAPEIRSPVLMQMQQMDGKPICFESTCYGKNATLMPNGAPRHYEAGGMKFEMAEDRRSPEDVMREAQSQGFVGGKDDRDDPPRLNALAEMRGEFRAKETPEERRERMLSDDPKGLSRRVIQR